MSKIFGQDIDLNKNEAHNFRFGNNITFPTLTASDPGFTFYHSANKKFYGWDGTDFIDLGAGGGGTPIDLSDYVDRTTNQTIGGIKTFTSPLHVSNNIIYNEDTSVSGFLSGGCSGYLGDSTYYFTKDTLNTNGALNFNNISDDRVYAMQDKSGTIAHLDDIPDTSDFVTIAGFQTITGFKEMSGGLYLSGSGSGIEFQDSAASPASGVGSLSFNLSSHFRISAAGVSGFYRELTFDSSNVDDARSYILQNKSGTLAHLDDIVGGSSPVETDLSGSLVVESATGDVSYTFSVAEAKKIKIGNCVILSIILTSLSKTGTTDGNLRITGFGEATANNSLLNAKVQSGVGSSLVATTAQVNGGAITFYKSDNSTPITTAATLSVITITGSIIVLD